MLGTGFTTGNKTDDKGPVLVELSVWSGRWMSEVNKTRKKKFSSWGKLFE